MNKKAMGFLTWMLLLAMVVALATSGGTVYASLLEAPTLTLGSGPMAAPTLVGSVHVSSLSPGTVAVNPTTDRVYVNFYSGTSVGQVAVVDVSSKTNPTIVTTLTASNYQGLTVNPTTNRFYVYDGLYNRNILVYDSSDNSPKATVYNCHAGFDPAIDLIYSASQCGNDNDLLQVLVNYVSGNCPEKESQFESGRGGEI